MAQLGPAMAFETLGKILLVGLCGLTHYKRLELLATFAVTTIIVDFFDINEKVLKLWNPFSRSFFKAGLSLVIEPMFTKAGRPQWDVTQIIKSLPTDEVQNPVVYRLDNRWQHDPDPWHSSCVFAGCGWSPWPVLLWSTHSAGKYICFAVSCSLAICLAYPWSIFHVSICIWKSFTYHTYHIVDDHRSQDRLVMKKLNNF